jgi:hypothetical protein
MGIFDVVPVLSQVARLESLEYLEANFSLVNGANFSDIFHLWQRIEYLYLVEFL